MINSEKRAKYDQSIAEISEMLPAMWFSMYNGLKKAGFQQNEAFDLLKTYIISSNVNSVYPSPPNINNNDEDSDPT